MYKSGHYRPSRATQSERAAPAGQYQNDRQKNHSCRHLFKFFCHLTADEVILNAGKQNKRDGFHIQLWVLQDTPGWNRAAIDAGIAAGHLKVINLTHRIPVAWVYVTGWVSRDGTVNFREDVYKHDDSLDRNALADAAAGAFVAPVKAAAPSPPREIKQISNLDSR